MDVYSKSVRHSWEPMGAHGSPIPDHLLHLPLCARLSGATNPPRGCDHVLITVNVLQHWNYIQGGPIAEAMDNTNIHTHTSNVCALTAYKKIFFVVVTGVRYTDFH